MLPKVSKEGLLVEDFLGLLRSTNNRIVRAIRAGTETRQIAFSAYFCLLPAACHPGLPA